MFYTKPKTSKWLSLRSAPVCVVLLLGLPIAASAGWSTGTSLPDLTQKGLAGALPQLKGKVVLVDFWASWCGPCLKSFPALDALHDKYASKGLVVLAVSVDAKVKDYQRFLGAHPVSFAVVHDTGHTLVAEAGVKGMPTSFVVDREGVIRFVHSGFHGDKTKDQYESEIRQLLGTPAL